MTKEETSEKYKIPVEILDEYESWGLCNSVREVMGAWQYDDHDIERLSMIMTLHDIGYNSDEIQVYIKDMIAGKANPKFLSSLNKKRDTTLNEIHFYEKRLERLDYLRFEMKKAKE